MTPFPFNPTAQATFTFSPTLDGQQYQGIVTWSLFGQRYYLNLYSLSNVLVVARALVGSPGSIPLQALTWLAGKATATTVAPHGLKIGNVVTLTVFGVTPDGYNGTFQCVITGPSTFTFSISANPGTVTALGSVSYNINLVSGLFATSSLIYRTPARQFEVYP
jgi:hypothetical protein